MKSNIVIFLCVSKRLDCEGLHFEIPRIWLEITKSSPRYWRPKLYNYLLEIFQSMNFGKFELSVVYSSGIDLLFCGRIIPEEYPNVILYYLVFNMVQFLNL